MDDWENLVQDLNTMAEDGQEDECRVQIEKIYTFWQREFEKNMDEL